MRVAIYCRISREETSRGGLSLPMQAEACRRKALADGAASVEAFTDDGYTGTNLNRPALQTLLSRLPNFDALYVYRMDRLCRNLRDRLALIDAFVQAGVSFHSTTERVDLDTIMGRAMVSVAGIFAQVEVETLRERVRDALAYRVEVEGKNHGQPPYGYCKQERGGDFFPEPGEARWVRDIFARYARGESLYQITRALNAADAPTKRGASGWLDSTVRGILASPVYIGQRVWHGEALPGSHEALVDRRVWRQAQARLAANLTIPSQSRASSLAPLLRCGMCGKPVVKAGRSLRPDGSYRDYGAYRCSARYQEPHDQRHPPCASSAPTVEEAIWRYATRYMGEELGEALRLREEQRLRRAAESHAPELRTQLRQVEDRQARLLRGYSLGNMSEEVLSGEAVPLAAERDRLLVALRDLAPPPGLADLRHLAGFADPRRAIQRRRAKPGDVQVAFLRRLFYRVDLYPRRLVFYHAPEEDPTPEPPAEVLLPRRYQPTYGVGVFLHKGEPLG